MTISVNPVSGDFDDVVRTTIYGAEGPASNFYQDSVGVPTVGYGFALLIKNGSSYEVRSDLSTAFSGIYSFSSGETTLLNNIAAQLNSHNLAGAQSLFANKGSDLIISGTGLTEPQAGTLFDHGLDSALATVRAKTTAVGTTNVGDIFEAFESSHAGSQELAAVYSLVYNTPAYFGPNLAAAIHGGDRAEAWYEIRYQSNGNDLQGLANRHFAESEKFGLYDDKNNISDEEALHVLHVWDSHKATIADYEGTYTIPGGVENIAGEVQEALDVLAAHHNVTGDVTLDDPHADHFIHFLDTAPTTQDDIDASLYDLHQSIADLQFWAGTGFISPLVVDLDGDTVADDLVSNADGVFFDIDGDGFAEKIGWTNGNDALLVRDLNSNGVIDSRAELFYDNGGSTAFDMLGQLDATVHGGNNDGKVDSLDGGWSSLQLWRDLDHDGYSDANELLTPESQGVYGFDYARQNYALSPTSAHGNVVDGRSNWLHANGTTGGHVDDVFFNTDQTNSWYVGSDLTQAPEVSFESVVMPLSRGYGDVAALHIALTENATLMGMMEGFVQFDTQTSFDDINRSAQEIVMEWMGTSGIGAHDYYSNIDSQIVGFFGALTNIDPATIDLSQSSYIPEDMWSAVFREFTARFLVQSAYSEVFQDSYYRFDTDQLVLVGDLSDILDRAADAAPAGAEAANLYWSEIGNILIDHADQFSLTASQMQTELNGAAGHAVIVYTDFLWSREAGSNYGNLTSNDYLLGSSGAETLKGGSGTDFIRGEGGNDSLDGGLGNDIIYAGNDGARLYGGAGDDSLTGGSGADTIDGGSNNNTISGGGGNDSIIGGVGNDTISGGDGNDNITANGGVDSIDGGDGNDTITAAGTITILGGAGDDTVTITAAITGNSSINLGSGQNTLLQTGTASANFSYTTIITAGNSGDSITFGRTNASVIGGDGADTITTTAGADYIFGGGGNDSIDAGTGANTVDGGDGNDHILGNTSNDSILGGAGNDTIDASNGTNTVDGGDGADSITSGSGNDSILGGAGDDTISAGNGTNTVHGGAGNDIIVVGTGADLVYGDADNDSITGGGASDTIYGGAGQDTISGGSNADTFAYLVGDSASGTSDVISDFVHNTDKIDLAMGLSGVGAGADQLTTSYNSGSNQTIISNTAVGFELHLTGNITLTDNDFIFRNSDGTLLSSLTGADTINGSSGADVINGAAGADSISGGSGNDTLFGGSGNDTILSGAGEDNITGGAGDDVFVYQHISDSSGVDGYDYINGFTQGSDKIDLSAMGYTDISQVFLYDGGSFTAFGDPGDGFSVLLDGSYTLTGSDFIFANGITGTSGANTLTGTSGLDVISGLGGNDTISAGDGNDTIISGTGSDSLTGGAGDDIFRYQFVSDSSGVGGYDWVTDFTQGHDLIDVSKLGFTDFSQIFVYDGGSFTAVGDPGGGFSALFAGSYTFTAADFIFAHGITGTASADTLTGTSGRDVITGLGGDDTINGGVGDDSIFSGAGSDNLTGSYGEDIFIYTEVNDSSGVGGYDYITDFVHGDDQIDLSRLGFTNFSQLITYDGGTFTAIGDAGGGFSVLMDGTHSFTSADFIFANAINGTSGANNITGTSGRDVIICLEGNDTISAGIGADTIDAGVGNDTIIGGGCGDSMTGSYGDDVFVYNIVSDSSSTNGYDTITDFTHGEDRIDVSSLGYTSFSQLATYNGGSFWAVGDAGTGLTILINGGSHSFTSADFILANAINGTSGADTLTGNSGKDVIDGLGGNDTLDGGVGHDTLIGGAGADSMTGSYGEDSFTYHALSESTDSLRDIIVDFTQGDDLIDLTGLGFTGVTSGTGSGSVIGFTQSGGHTYLDDADSTFSIDLVGTITLTSGDFIFS